MLRAALQRQCGEEPRRWALGVTAVVVATTTSAGLVWRTAEAEADASHHDSHTALLETDLMDRIAAKPYVNFHNMAHLHSHDSWENGRSSSSGSESQNHSNSAWAKLLAGPRSRRRRQYIQNDVDDDDILEGYNREHDHDAKQQQQQQRLLWDHHRPPGVPRRVRILAIDVPQMRHVFDGECRLNLGRVYPDGVAPPKVIERPKRHSKDIAHDSPTGKEEEETTSEGGEEEIEGMEEKTKMTIVQKSLARSIIRCRNRKSKRIGVELLESSVFDLNPNNMRKTWQLGESYRYDPGKYSKMKVRPGEEEEEEEIVNNVNHDDNDNNDDMNNDDIVTDDDSDKRGSNITAVKEEKGSMSGGNDDTTVATIDDEVHAPWNQYAWIEEMQLRVSNILCI
eukprot:scaffold17975_cov55-Attheya_sp.AAC.2